MVKVVFFLDCDDCGQSYSHAVVCSGKDSDMWHTAIEDIMHEAWLRQGWCSNEQRSICGPCFDANCRMSVWLQTAQEQSNQ